MKSLAVKISAPGRLQEILVAELSDFNVHGFEQDDHHLEVFFPSDSFTEEVRASIRGILIRHGLPGQWHERVIPERNWNSDWEKSIKPVSAPPFYIRPSWAEPRSGREDSIELVIDPQMSFGTGHHESTRLALKHLGACREKLSRVLDVGTGTGILAIASAKMGARYVLGIDLDPWSFRNALENVELNQVADIVNIRQGTSESVKEKGFTLILANISRTVLTRELSAYIQRAASQAEVILSGLQFTDKPIIMELLSESDCSPIEEQTEADWWSVRASCPKF